MVHRKTAPTESGWAVRLMRYKLLEMVLGTKQLFVEKYYFGYSGTIRRTCAFGPPTTTLPSVG